MNNVPLRALPHVSLTTVGLGIALAGCVSSGRHEADAGRQGEVAADRDTTSPHSDSGSATGASGGSGSTGSGAGGTSAGGASGDGGVPGGTGGGSGSSGSGGVEVDGGMVDAGACGLCPALKSHCVSGVCTECVEDGDCAEVCVSGVCEQCRGPAECQEPDASLCVEGSCEPCAADEDCMHLDRKICDAGLCVECTAERQDLCPTSATSRFVCNVLQRTCSTTAERSSANLCEKCVSDRQCQAGQLCVQQLYDEVDDDPDEGPKSVGWFCFWREDATQDGAPDGDCANMRPFVDTISGAQSIQDTEATVCGLRATTCPAYQDYSIKPCDDEDDDEACGDLDFESDALCEQFSSSVFRCTTPCLSSDDCRPAVSCDTSQPTGHCEL